MAATTDPVIRHTALGQGEKEVIRYGLTAWPPHIQPAKKVTTKARGRNVMMTFNTTMAAQDVIPRVTSETDPYTGVPRWRDYVRDRLTEIGHSADINPTYPAHETLARAGHVVHALLPLGCPTPSVVPGDDRAVVLVWQKAGLYIELEIGDGWQHFYSRPHGDSEGAMSGDPLEELPLFVDVLNHITEP